MKGRRSRRKSRTQHVETNRSTFAEKWRFSLAESSKDRSSRDASPLWKGILIAVAGAVVGAALGALATHYFTARTESLDFRQAAVVVDDELARDAMVIWDWYGDKTATPDKARFYKRMVTDDRWRTYQGTLAKYVSHDVYVDITSAYTRVYNAQNWAEIKYSPNKPMKLPHWTTIYSWCHDIQLARQNLLEAYLGKDYHVGRIGCEV